MNLKKTLIATVGVFRAIIGLDNDNQRSNYVQVNNVQHTPPPQAQHKQTAPKEMSIEQKVARFNEIFATDPANRTEEETRLMKELAPQVNEYMKKKILGQLGVEISSKPPINNVTVPVEKAPVKTTVATTEKAQTNNSVAPAEKIREKEAKNGKYRAFGVKNGKHCAFLAENGKHRAFLAEFQIADLVVTVFQFGYDGTKILFTYDEDGEDGEEIYASPSDENTRVDVVEIFDESGDSWSLEIIGYAVFKYENYLITTPYLEEEPADDEVTNVFIMKEVQDNGESMFEEVRDEVLYDRIFSAFKRAYDNHVE